MKKYILLGLGLVFWLSGCGGKPVQDQNKVYTEYHGDDYQVQVVGEADINRELKNLGFVLPQQDIKAPDFTLNDLKGVPLSLNSLQGKVVLLNFWGTWCAYCREEMPSMQRMYDALQAKEFEILAVNVNDTPAQAKSYIEANKFSFPVLLDSENKVTQTYGIRGFPTTFIIDKKGNLAARLVGSMDWSSPEVIEVLTKIINHEL